jgi:hypothetical protein
MNGNKIKYLPNVIGKKIINNVSLYFATRIHMDKIQKTPSTLYYCSAKAQEMWSFLQDICLYSTNQ